MPTRKRKAGSSPPKPLRCSASPITIRSNCCDLPPPEPDWLGSVSYEVPLSVLWEFATCGVEGYGTTFTLQNDVPNLGGAYEPSVQTMLGCVIGVTPGASFADVDAALNGFASYADSVYQPCGGSKWFRKPGAQGLLNRLPVCYHKLPSRVIARAQATLIHYQSWAPDYDVHFPVCCWDPSYSRPTSGPVSRSSVVWPWDSYARFYAPASPPENPYGYTFNPYATGSVIIEASIAGAYSTFSAFVAAATANVEWVRMRWFLPPFIRSGVHSLFYEGGAGSDGIGSGSWAFDTGIKTPTLTDFGSVPSAIYYRGALPSWSYSISGWTGWPSPGPSPNPTCVHMRGDPPSYGNGSESGSAGDDRRPTIQLTWQDEDFPP